MSWPEQARSHWGILKTTGFLICLATLVWTCVGLLFLGAMLKRLWNSDALVLMTLALVTFGTNLYTYSVTNFGLSHTLAFLLFAALLYNIVSWDATHKPRHLYGLAVACGWIFLTRPPDITIYLLPLAYGAYSITCRAANRSALASQWRHVAGALLSLVAIAFVQLLYWKWTTGDFFCYSYEGEAFDFLHPKILKGLFSWQKGWFVYTPLVPLACLGFVPLSRRNRRAALLLLAYLVGTVYLVFSWEQWWYGWGFGCRALIESLAVLSIPLSALIAEVRSRGIWIKTAALAVAVFVVFLNVFQTNQHIIQTLPGEGMTRDYYWRIWLKLEADEADRYLLRRLRS